MYSNVNLINQVVTRRSPSCTSISGCRVDPNARLRGAHLLPDAQRAEAKSAGGAVLILGFEMMLTLSMRLLDFGSCPILAEVQKV